MLHSAWYQFSLDAGFIFQLDNTLVSQLSNKGSFPFLEITSCDGLCSQKCVPHGKFLEVYIEFESALLVLPFISIALVKLVALCRLVALQQALDSLTSCILNLT